MQSNMPHYHLRNLHSHQSLLLLCYYVNILGFYENHTSLNSSVQPTVLLLPVTKLAYFCKHAGLQIAWVTGMESTPVTMMMIGVRTILVLGYWALSSIHRYWVVLYDNCIGVQYCSDVLMTAVAST